MRIQLAAVLTLLLTLLAACSGGDEPDQDGARDAADGLAAALTAGDLTGVELVGDATAYDDITDALEGVPVKVVVERVKVDGDLATATLGWSWEVGAEPWTYATEAQLQREGGDWQAIWSPAMIESSLVEGEELDLDTLTPRRGEVLARNGEPIVTQRDVIRYGLDKSKIKTGKVKGSARRIAELLDLDVKSYVERAVAAGDKAFVEAIVLRAEDARETVPASYDDIPGAIALGTTRDLAPTSTFAAPLLGRVGEATAELIEESDGALEAGDVVGLSGLQARYDEQLRGTPGVRVSVVGGAEDRVLLDSDPVDGVPLKLTLDLDLQQRAEEALAGVGPASAIVALDPKTGAILAAASGPGSNGQNTATFGQYAPGSTMKVVSSLALLRNGMQPQSPVNCPATTVVDGKTFKNYDDYPASGLGRITLRQAVANSCNTAFVDHHDDLDDDALTEAAAALGLGVDHDLGFPAYFGQVPTPAGETEKAADLIGQGKVLASPMAMAAVAASVRAGKTVVPRLLADLDVEQVAPKEPLTPAEAKALRGLMRAVVTDGSGRFLASQGNQIGAKTGTAEYGTPARNGELATHAWMIAQDRNLAVAVFVETGQSGSQTAGPLLTAFLR